MIYSNLVQIFGQISLFTKKIKTTPITLVVFFVILLRIPNLFEPYWYGDEAIYLTLGEGVRQGLTLYKDIFDHKPPLIYLLAAVAGSIFWFKFLLLVSHIASVFMFWKLAEKLFKQSSVPEKSQKRAVFLAGGFFALFTTLPTLEGNIANAEIFMSLPIIAGLLYVFSLKRESLVKLYLAGIVFSLAVLYKVPAVLEIGALFVFWFLTSWGSIEKLKHAFSKSFALGLGVLTPIAVTIVYYATQGALNDYLSAGLLQNFGYIASWSAPVVSQAQTFSGDLTFRTLVLVLTVCALFLLRRRIDQTLLFVSLWFVFALFAMLLSGRPYPHYIIQIIAPLGLLLAILVNGRDSQRFWTTPLFLIFLASLVFYKFTTYPILSYYQNFLSFAVGAKTHDNYLSYFDQRIPRTYRLAQYIVRSTSPKDRIFIWGTEPELYALSRRLPPGRYTTSFHINDFGGREETLAALENNPPKYILINTKEQRVLPGLHLFLYNRYIYLENFGEIEVWKEIGPALIRALRK